MPLVELYYDPKRFPSEEMLPFGIGVIAENLRSSVAIALSVEEADGQLSPEDVEVRVREKSPLDATDYDIEVTVWAKHYPQREAKLDEATAEIAETFGRFISGAVRGWVYVLLSPAGFVEVDIL